MTYAYTLDAVAKRLGVTKERVRQLETIAMIEQLNKQSWALKGVGRE